MRQSRIPGTSAALTESASIAMAAFYVASRMGIQVCDQDGRVDCIIPTPNGRITNLCFGRTNFDILYATCGDKV